MGIRVNKEYVCNVCNISGTEDEVITFTPETSLPEAALNNTVVIHISCFEDLSAMELLAHLEISDNTYNIEGLPE